MNFRKAVKAVIPKKLFGVVEPWGHLVEAVLFNLINGFPARNMKVIGVTGTDGKTTTCFLIHKMLIESGHKVGLMTTVSLGIGDNLKPQTHHMTTVTTPVLMKRLKQFKRAGVEWLVLEATSQALAQNRVWGVPFSIAVMTNVSREHLDWHGTLENYLEAKRRLFKLTSGNKKGFEAGAINADDPNADYFSSEIKNPLMYGIKKGELKAEAVRLKPGGSSFNAKTEGETYKIICNLPGKFNVYNCLAAVAVGRIIGLETLEIEQGIASLTSVPGRMQEISEGQDFRVIIDYAVTPSALETALKTLKEITKGRVLLVFGATGNRDQGKRPIMGRIAAKNADRIFLTDDETYTEVPALIRQAVMSGIKKAGGARKTTEIDDRGEAIKVAFEAAGKADTVLITGMGHQTTRNMGGQEEPWSDIEATSQALANLRRKWL